MKVLYIILIYIIFYYKGLYYNLFGPKIEKNRNENIYIIGDYLSGIIAAWNLKKNGYNPVILCKNSKLNDPFRTKKIDDSIVPIKNYIWPKEKNEHWRELLDELNIKKKNINRSFNIKWGGEQYIHGVNTELSIKFKYEIFQWIKMVDFCKTMNKSFNINRQFNPLNIIQIKFIARIYKCDNPLFIKYIVNSIYYEFPNILDYPISILEYISDILPIDNSKFPEYETFLDIEESSKIIEALTKNIDVVYNCKIQNIEYKKGWSIKTDNAKYTSKNIIYNCSRDDILKLNMDEWSNKLINMIKFHKPMDLNVKREENFINDKNKNYMTYVIDGQHIENLSIWKNDTYLMNDEKMSDRSDSESRVKECYYNTILFSLLSRIQGMYGRYFLGDLNYINNRSDMNIKIMNGIKISMMVGSDYPFTRLIDKYKYL